HANSPCSTCKLSTKDSRARAGPKHRLAVRQPVFLDVVAIGLEQHVGTAMLADGLGGPLDHAVALAGLLILHLAGCGDLEALFGAGFGLQLGHLALLIGVLRGSARIAGISFQDGRPWSGCSGLSVNRRHGSPYWPGGDGRRYGRRSSAMQPSAVGELNDAKTVTRHRNLA